MRAIIVRTEERVPARVSMLVHTSPRCSAPCLYTWTNGNHVHPVMTHFGCIDANCVDKRLPDLQGPSQLQISSVCLNWPWILFVTKCLLLNLVYSRSYCNRRHFVSWCIGIFGLACAGISAGYWLYHSLCLQQLETSSRTVPTIAPF